jgi:hypothetical protein
VILSRLWHVDAAGATAVVALAALVYVAGVKPLHDARAAAAARQTELATRRDQSDRLSATLKTLDLRLADAVQTQAGNTLRLEPADQVNARVARLTALATANGIRVDEIKPGQPSRAGRFTTVPMHLTGIGSYSAFVGFIHDVRVQSPDTGISMFDAGCVPCLPQAQATFTLDLVWFAAPADPAVRAADAAGTSPQSH